MTTITPLNPSTTTTNPSINRTMAPTEAQAVAAPFGADAVIYALTLLLTTGHAALEGQGDDVDAVARNLIERLERLGHEGSYQPVRIIEMPYTLVVANDVLDRRLGDIGVSGTTGRVEGSLRADALEPPPSAVPAPLEPALGTPFNAFLAPEGVESSDGRMLEPGTTTWPDTPMPLMVQDTAAHGVGTPAPSWFAGTIEQVFRDPTNDSRLMARGHLATGDDGARAEQLIRSGLRSISIDAYSDTPPAEQPTLVSSEGEPIKVLTRYADARIRGATVVPIPAFENACLWFDDEPMPAAVLAPADAAPAPSASPNVHRPPPPAALLASAGGPLNPPRAWFERPEPDQYQPMTTTEQGAIYGHAARFGTCHIGHVGVCETAPRSATNYRYFHTDAVQTKEGTALPCGVLTLDTTHQRNDYASARATMDHYDHTGTAVAKIRARDGRHGIWVCGAVRPGLAEEHLWALQGAKASGDWRDVRDQGQRFTRELVALLCVNTPGFPVPRPEVLVASGAIVEQYGELPCDSCEGATVDIEMTTPTETIDTLALRDRIAALERDVAALRAQASPAIVASAAERIGARRRSQPAPLELVSDESFDAYLAMNRISLAKYDADALKKMAKSGAAMPDRSYPIADEEDLTNAIRAVGRGSGSHDAIRVHIMKRARALGKADAIPKTWNSDGSMKT